MSYRSPLWMVSKDPRVTNLVTELQRQCREIQANPEEPHLIRFSSQELEEVREAFAALIRRGESRLHRLCSLLCRSFLPNYEMSSVVIGQVGREGERFTLVQALSHEQLFQMTDLDLGQRQLSRLRFLDDARWRRPNLVANFVEYQPQELDARGIHRLSSRIKAEEAIWNKVVDEMFCLDDLVHQDKQLRHMSRYVKDVFGLKVITADAESARRFHQELKTHIFSDQILTELKCPSSEETLGLEFLETKDYIDGDPKRSGWKALKSVIRWWDTTFELQVQPLRNYLRERERLSQESHISFKNHRDELREQVSSIQPLYGFYRSLLRWLFLRPDSPAPSFSNVEVELTR